jgi:Domain of unknown function (DUF4404)
MTEQPAAGSPNLSEIQNRLENIAQRLREAGNLEPETKQELADIVEELGKALASCPLPSPEMAHLSDSAAHLVQALHEKHDTSMLAAARDRLEEAIVRVETGAPVVAGLVRRLVDTLANLGI